MGKKIDAAHIKKVVNSNPFTLDSNVCKATIIATYKAQKEIFLTLFINI